MDIILLERIEKLGGIGDVVTVKDGYARNFLLPNKKALRANEANKKLFEANRAKIEADNAARRSDAEGQAKTVEGAKFVLIRQASNAGQLYGSVSVRDIVEALHAAGHSAVTKAMVVLDRLSPDQRVAVVLHDGFGVAFGEIADVLGTSAAAARQLASRGRRAMSDSPTPHSDSSHDEIVGRLLTALASGDLAAVVTLLHPDVTFTGDSNRMAPTAAQVIHGPDKVARFMFGLAQRYGPRFFEAALPARINGELGLYTVGMPADGGWPQLHPRISALTVRDGKVWAIWDVANPDKFSASPLRPNELGTHPRS